MLFRSQNGSGTLSLTKTGSGTLTLSNTANTYTGTTTISAGTLKLGASGVIADSSAVSVSGTFDLAGFSEAVGSIAGGGTITSSTTGAVTLTAGGDNTSTSFSGVIQNGSGTLSLTKTGSGTLTLSNTANTYTGATTISAGTLKLGASGVISDTSAVQIANGATFDLNSYSETVASIADVSGNTTGAITLGSGTLTVVGSATATFSGVDRKSTRLNSSHT